MRRIRACMTIFSGVFTIWASWRLPQSRTGGRVSRLGRFVRGSTLIMQGVSRGLLPNPRGQTAYELEHVTTRVNGWLRIAGGCSGLWFCLRGSQRWPVEDQSLIRRTRILGVLGVTGGLMQGVADGVMAYPPRWNARLLRRVGSALVFVSGVLMFAPFVVGVVRENRQLRRQGWDDRPASQPGTREETAMTGWQEGQLLRTPHHRFGITGNVAVTVGRYDLEHGQFRVTHQLGFEPPRAREEMALCHRQMTERGFGLNTLPIRIAGIAHDPENEDQMIYIFEQVGEWKTL